MGLSEGEHYDRWCHAAPKHCTFCGSKQTYDQYNFDQDCQCGSGRWEELHPRSVDIIRTRFGKDTENNLTTQAGDPLLRKPILRFSVAVPATYTGAEHEQVVVMVKSYTLFRVKVYKKIGYRCTGCNTVFIVRTAEHLKEEVMQHECKLGEDTPC